MRPWRKVIRNHRRRRARCDRPEPLADDNPLWKAPNLVVTPHIGGQSDDVVERRWRLLRENVRRFVAGEPLLCVVDKAKGY
jgi:phosphoglycerate dehydrogenase-like enzyme